jgi:hypothetical protein
LDKNGTTEHRTIAKVISTLVCLCLLPGVAFATQGHAGVEGVWVHQFAHLFFLFSMMLLIYWLRRAGLVKEPGWRYIQYAASFFIIWNIDTIFVHFLDEQIQAVQVSHIGDWRIRITASQDTKGLAALYYITKLDHLLCVPAMICLMLGLRHMLQATRTDETKKAVR